MFKTYNIPVKVVIIIEEEHVNCFPDHISSSPAILFPVKALTELCHQYGVWILIDGAHGPGQLNLNLDELNADFYAGKY